MFWRHASWSLLNNYEVSALLELLNQGLQSSRGVTFSSESGAEDRLMVDTVRSRQLMFYSNHWLYELSLSRSNPMLHGRGITARVYAVISLAGSKSPDSGVAPHLRANPAECAFSVTLLDWKSATIFQLNERDGMSLRREGAFDPSRTVEYLDFFTSFLVGDSETPFLIVRDGTFSAPGGLHRLAAARSFEERIGDVLSLDSPYEPAPAEQDLTSHDGPDARQGPAASEDSTPPTDPSPPRARAASSTGLTSEAATAADEPIADIELASASSEQGIATLHATVLYEGEYYQATFEVAERPRKDGGVETYVMMTNDDVITTPPLSLERVYVEHLGDAQVPALVYCAPRSEIHAREMLARLARATRTVGSRPLLENLRVRGTVDLRDLRLSQPLWVKDIEFLGDVILDDSRWQSGVNFTECKFAQRLTATNMVIEGDLILRHAVVLGATRSKDEAAPSICLDGARIEGNLDARRLRVDGTFSAKNAKLRGSARLHGIQVRRRPWPGDAQLDLLYARVDGGIYLCPAEDQAPHRHHHFRSSIAGGINLYGVETSEVKLQGIRCNELDLSYANIHGLLDLHMAHLPNQPGLGARTQIRGGAELRHARAKEIFLCGALIDGYLSLLGVHVTGSIFARPPSCLPYRTRIGGDLLLSGAQVGGDCDFGGVEISGGFEMRTGSANRLSLSLQAVVRSEERVRLDYFPAEVGWLELVGVSGLKSLHLAGIVVNGRASSLPGSRESITVAQISVLGDISMYWGSKEDVTLADAIQLAKEEAKRTRRAASSAEDTTQQSEVVIEWVRDCSPRSCSASVTGSIGMRRVTTAGRIDLTNMKVSRGQLKLDDARIGTDLLARSSALRGRDFRDGSRDEVRLALVCGGLDLDGAKVDGDVVLSGLTLEAGDGHDGSLRARGLQVGGKFELWAGGTRFARIAGKLLLAGASAAHLKLHEENVRAPTVAASAPLPASPSPRASDSHSADLSRARFGILEIEEAATWQGALAAGSVGTMLLASTDISSWRVRTDRERDEPSARDYLRVLLRHKIDRPTWMAIESRLRNENRPGEADQLYRAMLASEPARGLRVVWKGMLRYFWGFGTRVWPAVAISVALALLLFGVLADPSNVKASPALVAQLQAQCRSEAAQPFATVSPRCGALKTALGGRGADALLEVRASDLDAESYDLSSALMLTARYSLPVFGAFGETDWTPLARAPASVSLFGSLGMAPAIAATCVRLVNTFLLSFAIAFVTRRWLR